jgi:hypothetical protein
MSTCHFKFDHLNDYCILDLFKYLSFTQLVKFSRVCIRFDKLSKCKLNLQTSVIISKNSNKLKPTFICSFNCNVEHHKPSNVLDLWWNPEYAMTEKNVTRIISKIFLNCVNIKSLVWHENNIEFSHKLLEIFSNLEHVQFSNSASQAIDFIEFANENVNEFPKLKCFQIYLPRVMSNANIIYVNEDQPQPQYHQFEGRIYDQDQMDSVTNMNNIIGNFVKKCPNLECLFIETENTEISNGILNKLHKLKRFCWTGPGLRDNLMILNSIKGSQSLETLTIFHHNKVDLKEIESILPKLCLLSLFDSKTPYTTSLLRKLGKLKTIHFVNTEVDFSLVDVNYNLIKAHFFESSFKNFKYISKQFPNLVDLSLLYNPESRFVLDFIEFNLCNLKCFVAHNVIFKTKSVDMILKGCPNLKNISFVSCTFPFTGEYLMGLISKSSLHFQKRFINLKLKTCHYKC